MISSNVTHCITAPLPTLHASLSILHRTCTVTMIFLNLFLSCQAFVSPLFMKDSFAGYNIVSWPSFLSFQNFMSFCSLYTCTVSVEKSKVNLSGIPLNMIWYYSLAFFRIPSLLWTFDSCYLHCIEELLRFFWVSWPQMFICFPRLYKCSALVAFHSLSFLLAFLTSEYLPFSAVTQGLEVVHSFSPAFLNFFFFV